MSKSISKTSSNKALQYLVYQYRTFEYNIKRKAKPFPSIFQIQTINLCNAACEMCPISKMSNVKPEKMSNRLYEKIIKEISQEHLTYTSVYPYLQNEPLMDADIFNKIKLIKKFSNGRISTGLVTNGSLLTEKKIDELVKSEIDEIIISLDAYTEETFNKIRQGLDLKKILKNIDNLLNSDFKGYLSVKFVIQKKNISEIKIFKNYWKEKKVSIETSYINNRTGDVNNFNNISLKNNDIGFFKRLNNKLQKKLIMGCHMPIINFNILSNGDVILCCNDYSRKVILGNVKESSIKEIWNNKEYKMIRELIYKNKFSEIPACRKCDKIIG
jgi:radical SAM protein with 4Fe4S-binding SPASM domain